MFLTTLKENPSGYEEADKILSFSGASARKFRFSSVLMV
jgi:hypothetical protein